MANPLKRTCDALDEDTKSQPKKSMTNKEEVLVIEPLKEEQEANCTLVLPNKELEEWLATCPDRDLFVQQAALAFWLRQTGKCSECEDFFENRDLRHDMSYWESGKLICKECWNFFNSGTSARPDYKAPPWPEKYVPLNEGFSPNVNGKIMDVRSGKIVGTVKNYNYSTHFADKVVRDAFPGGKEMGSLGPYDKVVDAVGIPYAPIEGMQGLYEVLGRKSIQQ